MTRMRTSSGISSAAKSMVWISKPASSNIDIIDAEVVSPGYQASFSHGYYKKLNYVQLRNITLGYRVNQKFVRKIGLSAIDVNFSVNNVCAFSNMRQMLNYDNTWFASFPTARSYVLGLSLTF